MVSVTVTKIAPNPQHILLKCELPTTTDSDDTFTVTAASYGGQTFEWINGNVHTTEDQVIITEAPTTTVTSGVMTVTVGGSSQDDKKRVYLLLMDA